MQENLQRWNARRKFPSAVTKERDIRVRVHIHDSRGFLSGTPVLVQSSLVRNILRINLFDLTKTIPRTRISDFYETEHVSLLLVSTFQRVKTNIKIVDEIPAWLNIREIIQNVE